MKFDDVLYGMTTIIEAKSSHYISQGSGFFYSELAPKGQTKGGQWRKVEETWLVTNRHVALLKINDREMLPDTFTFNLRQVVDKKVQWVPVSLPKEEYKRRLKLHVSSFIDVAVIAVGDLICKQAIAGAALVSHTGLTSDNLPEHSKIPISAGDDILVAGYPRGFYDLENKYPIVKSGIIASKWGCNFNGHPLFLIDSKLFPGSSGSVVLTKPQHFAVIDGKIMHNSDGAYSFLGIYSGEPIQQNAPIELEDMTIIKKNSYNVGNVWYSSLVPEIISHGISTDK